MKRNGKFKQTLNGCFQSIKPHLPSTVRLLVAVIFLILAARGIALEKNEPGTAESNPSWVDTMLKSVGPELAGIAIGFLIVDVLNEWRQNNHLKKQLIIQARSKHNYVTDTAIRTLKAYGWLTDGTLRNADLEGANLENSDLVHRLQVKDLRQLSRAMIQTQMPRFFVFV